jgi:hypothetical protein
MPPTSGQFGSAGMMPPPPPTGYMPPSAGPTSMQSRPGYPPSSEGMMTQPQGYGQQQQGDGYNTMPNVGGMSLSVSGMYLIDSDQRPHSNRHPLTSLSQKIGIQSSNLWPFLTFSNDVTDIYHSPNQ